MSVKSRKRHGRAVRRLRWQLTLSHLKAIAFTLVAMIVAALLISSAWWTHLSNSALQPVDDARVVANSVRGLVVHDLNDPVTATDSPQLSMVLRLMADGDVRLLSSIPPTSPQEAQFHAPVSSSLGDIAYLVVVSGSGNVIGSSDAAGGGFAPPERSEWTPLINASMNVSTSDPTRLVASRSGDGPVALGSYPILDLAGHPVAAVIVGKTAVPVPSTWWDFWKSLLFFGAAIVVVLAGASVFALASSTLLSYMLARRLVRRLERLGRAAEAFAAGDLNQRVDMRADGGSDDEVGQLARRFNAMADRLSDTLAELAAEKEMVENSLKAKRELTANVSHELRTPLASIRGHVESLLLRGDANDDRRSYLEVIHRQTEHLSRLIDDLFLLSTTEAGALSLTVRPVQLGEVIDEVVSSIQPAARAERRVSLLSEVEPGLPPVEADRQRVGQVLANLARNAVRYTPEGGLVAIRAARQDAQFALVCVEDTGEGIPPDWLEHVFERFYRGDPSRDRASGGAGLGLAIVRELVTAMGGAVSVDSVVGEGSRFSFTLPLAQEAAVLAGPRRV
jgi:signal transduction histidine kinase